MAPLLQQLPTHYHPKPHILKLHLHQNPSTPPKYQVMTIPTLILFKDPQPLHKLLRFQPKQNLPQLLHKHL
ncbi:thioredoxin domain-containing protein [Staphylococcus epidermidis]|uniref:thioredoxin domain-containing protein n=1 Tax=Staphylococcus epidermidis TaxID=1282 RepID=UPI0037DA50AD